MLAIDRILEVLILRVPIFDNFDDQFPLFLIKKNQDIFKILKKKFKSRSQFKIIKYTLQSFFIIVDDVNIYKHSLTFS